MCKISGEKSWVKKRRKKKKNTQLSTGNMECRGRGHLTGQYNYNRMARERFTLIFLY